MACGWLSVMGMPSVCRLLNGAAALLCETVAGLMVVLEVGGVPPWMAEFSDAVAAA